MLPQHAALEQDELDNGHPVISVVDPVETRKKEP
jgi:hypothetical protein